jgi:leucyl aminopeptidase (aminopeptidase T)
MTISEAKLRTWADYLLNYSLGGVKPDDVIMIKGEHIAWPLMSVLQDMIFADGGIADVNIVAPDNDRGKVWGASIARHGTEEQIQRVPAWHGARYEAMTKYIEILGAENPALSAGQPEDTAMAVMRADEAYKRIRLARSTPTSSFPHPCRIRESSTASNRRFTISWTAAAPYVSRRDIRRTTARWSCAWTSPTVA